MKKGDIGWRFDSFRSKGPEVSLLLSDTDDWGVAKVLSDGKQLTTNVYPTKELAIRDGQADNQAYDIRYVSTALTRALKIPSEYLYGEPKQHEER